jgi:hypothetical protein
MFTQGSFIMYLISTYHAWLQQFNGFMKVHL